LTIGKKEWLVLTALFSLILYKNAFAYIDPASGSYFLQLLLAGLLAALFALKIFWRNVKAFVQRVFSKGHKTTDNDG
jgi:hypothetical protein